MKLTFATPTLQALDNLGTDVLAIGAFADDRPLRDLAGLVDWRLNGQVSRVLQDERFGGALGETVMLPCRHRFGAERFLLFGLAESDGYDETRLAEAVEWMWHTLARLRSTSVAMPFPGAHRCSVAPGRAARLLVSAASRAYEGIDLDLRLHLIVRADDRREIQAALDGMRAAPAFEFIL